MHWIRGEKLGRGSFATVNLAIPKTQTSNSPPLMAVKSCVFPLSSSLKHCPEIIRCFGESVSYENGEKLYNILLEYASGGTLADKLKNSPDRRLPENDVRQITKSILRGVDYVHKSGYVHCDIKLQNILLFQNDVVKIADFGLAKKKGEEKQLLMRGTPLYMSPEMVAGGDQGAAADVWAVGCAAAEMLTGSPPWRCADVAGLWMRIGVGSEIPEISGAVSQLGRDFLERCFVRDPRERWTAEMLLNHPFICDNDFGGEGNNSSSVSPRCPFDFPDDWVSSVGCCSVTNLPLMEYESCAAEERLRELVNCRSPDWSVTDDWVTVR